MIILSLLGFYLRSLFLVLFFSLSIVISLSAFAASIEGLRYHSSSKNTRVVIDFSGEIHYTHFLLSNPHRLVLDLKNTVITGELPFPVERSPVLEQIRKSRSPSKETCRLVLELKKKISPKVFKLMPGSKGKRGHRIVIDLPYLNNIRSGSAHPPKGVKKKMGYPIPRDISQFQGNGDVIVAVDAGHGGEDPGSVGSQGHYEKSVTLGIAQELEALINATPGTKAIMTRQGDYFVSLDRRSEIARKHQAHLLISIHADAFETSQPRGASVFVLDARRVNSETVKWVEDHERQSELLGGTGQVLARNSSDKNISQTLIDLQFSHSQKEGYILANYVIHQLSRVTYMHRSKPVSASLAVLKSPDIPSVLVETGFISNPTEENLLLQRNYQHKIAQAISKAIRSYLDSSPPEKTLFFNRNRVHKHEVTPGESLSAIAKRYTSSVQALMVSNSMDSTKVRVGQILIIPN